MIQHKKIPFSDAFLMLSDYARTRIVEQLKSVAFIIIYLVVFQRFILGVPLSNALSIAGGIAMVVFGLAFFLEGLILGLMPLGERVGTKLPTKVGIIVIATFGLLLGFGATLAEPAISSLRLAGSTVTAWDSPLLFMMLERKTELLVLLVGIGVGVAVALGMFRFYYNFSIKPFIFILIPVALLLSLLLNFDDNLQKIIGLAWDSGAVTTGAVTVPLVLALGIGVSRASSKGTESASGFGIILLASLFPILSVLMLGIVLNTKAPKATTEAEFFSPAYRSEALFLFDDEEALLRHAFTHGSQDARKAFFDSEEDYYMTIRSLATDPAKTQALLGTRPLSTWVVQKASKDERVYFKDIDFNENVLAANSTIPEVIKQEFKGGLRAVVPLSMLLLIVLLGFLREKLRYKDEVALGLIFTLIGMTLLTAGIRLGLATLGSEVGAQLPRAFASEEKFIDRVVIPDFDESLVYEVISKDGTRKSYFNMMDNDKLLPIEFLPERYNENIGSYDHIVTQSPLFRTKLSSLGILLVLLFAFGMGYGATMAEPALNALGITVEGLTVGNIKRVQIVQIVSVGVGVGILLGLTRILFDIPLIWLILPPYVMLLPLTWFSEEEFSAIAWDSGGVTTGPVTVPLVLAMGLSIGGELNVVDGFGVLALASVFPIITVLVFGLIVQIKQQRSLSGTDNDDTNK
ncbi:MAG: DUF1538 domain-containing protein [Bacteroidales bacterium]